MENSFILWAAEKKVKDSDLIFTNSLKSTLHQEIYHKLADRLALLRPSFSDGISTLELLTELILIGHSEELFENSESLPSWKSHLRRLRYPVTAQNDESLKSKLESLPWPQGTKVKFERRGDRAGVEVKLFVSSKADMTKILAAFERVEKEIGL